jgi:very-short-patch-repair endonuclease
MNFLDKYNKYQNSINEKYSNTIKIIKFEDRTKITFFKCNKNHEFSMLGRKMIERKSCVCPICEKEIFNKQQEEKINKIFNNEYSLLSKYIKSSKKVLVRHNKCNNEYYITPDNIFQNRKCPFCSKKKPQRDTEWFKNKIIELYNTEYTLLSEYNNTNEKVLMRHNKCNNEYYTTPNNFIHGSRCPFCMAKTFKKKTTEEIKEEIKLRYKDNFILMSDYKNNKTKIKIKCTRCNKIIEVMPTDFFKKNGYKCMCERESKPEKYIEKILVENNINFIKEYKFNDCKDKKPLPFDFYLEDYNILIEYDGEQHFNPIYGSEKLNKTKLHDNIKSKYCLNNNIELIRINYRENLSNKLNEIVQRLSKPHI